MFFEGLQGTVLSWLLFYCCAETPCITKAPYRKDSLQGLTVSKGESMTITTESMAVDRQMWHWSSS